jgi:hypothetical protein
MPLDWHNVEYILVGGLGAHAHVDERHCCVPEGGPVNEGDLDSPEVIVSAIVRSPAR